MVVASFVFENNQGGDAVSFPTGLVRLTHTIPSGRWRLLKYTLDGPVGLDNAHVLRVLNERGKSIATDIFSFKDGVKGALGDINLPHDGGTGGTLGAKFDNFTDIPFFVDDEVKGLQFDLVGVTSCRTLCLVFEIPQRNL